MYNGLYSNIKERENMYKITITFNAEPKLSPQDLCEIEKMLLDYIKSDTLIITQVEIK